jgi:hypothetical protein
MTRGAASLARPRAQLGRGLEPSHVPSSAIMTAALTASAMCAAGGLLAALTITNPDRDEPTIA